MSEVNKYRFLFFIRYFGDAFFYPFISLYYKSIGLTDAKISLLLAITPIAAIFINPFYNLISKNVNVNRQILRVITIIEGLIIVLIANIHDYYTIAGLVVLLAIFGSSHYSLMDAVTATYGNINNVNYSSIRLWGSASYVIATTIAGFVNQATGGYQIAFYIAAFVFVISSLAYTMIKPVDIPSTNKQTEKRNLREVVTNVSFLFYIIFYLLVLGAKVVGDNMFAVYLKTRGVTDEQWGIIFSVFVLFEVLSLLYLNFNGYKFKDQTLLLVATLMCMVRFIVYGSYAPMWLTLFITIMRGTTWGIVLSIHYKYIIKLVGLKNATLAILILALFNNMFVGIGTAFAGTFIDDYGFSKYYLGLALIVFLGLIFLILTQFRKRLNNHITEKTPGII